jgi:hypothetical protein
MTPGQFLPACFPPRNIGTINPKGLHQVNGIPGHLGSMAQPGPGRPPRPRPPACSRARERATAAGHPDRHFRGSQARWGERPCVIG